MKVHTIDLHFQNEGHSIAAFLIESDKGLVLIETGPASTFKTLNTAIENLGHKVEDIKHVFLSHIHFDHAGAAWKFTNAKVYVNPAGLPHLASPEKLWNSAKQIYQDKMEELWGEMKPIPEENLIGVDEGDIIDLGNLKVEVFYTPGHAVHHNAYKIGLVIFTGDVAGVKIQGGPVVPPCPPPDINIELWKESIAKLKSLKPEALYLTHFGICTNVTVTLNELESILDSWSQEVYKYYKSGTTIEESISQFMAFVHKQLRKKGVDDKLLTVYEYANPSWMSVTGLFRYWKLKEQGRI